MRNGASGEEAVTYHSLSSGERGQFTWFRGYEQDRPGSG
jgi:hypothetical protein